MLLGPLLPSSSAPQQLARSLYYSTRHERTSVDKVNDSETKRVANWREKPYDRSTYSNKEIELPAGFHIEYGVHIRASSTLLTNYIILSFIFIALTRVFRYVVVDVVDAINGIPSLGFWMYRVSQHLHLRWWHSNGEHKLYNTEPCVRLGRRVRWDMRDVEAGTYLVRGLTAGVNTKM